MVVETFANLGLVMDYPDKASEAEKSRIAERFGRAFNDEAKTQAAHRLRSGLGQMAIEAYLREVAAALSAPPVEFRIVARRVSATKAFETIEEVSKFLEGPRPDFRFDDPLIEFGYEITYSDGTDFQRDFPSLPELRAVHRQLAELSSHMAKVLGAGAT